MSSARRLTAFACSCRLTESLNSDPSILHVLGVTRTKRKLHALRMLSVGSLRSKSEDPHHTSEVGEALRSRSEALRSRSEALRSTSEALRSRSETLRSRSEALRSRSETLRSTSEALRSRSEALRSTSESIPLIGSLPAHSRASPLKIGGLLRSSADRFRSECTNGPPYLTDRQTDTQTQVL